jgi:hypothetical protein
MDFEDLFGSPEPSIFQLGATAGESIIPPRTEISLDGDSVFPPDEGSLDGIPSRLAGSPKSSIPRLVDIAIELRTISLKRKREYAVVDGIDDGFSVNEVSHFLLWHVTFVQYLFKFGNKGMLHWQGHEEMMMVKGSLWSSRAQIVAQGMSLWLCWGCWKGSARGSSSTSGL